jgi:hypothetical protein
MPPLPSSRHCIPASLFLQTERVFLFRGCIREIAIIGSRNAGIREGLLVGRTRFVWPRLVVQTHHAHLFPTHCTIRPHRAQTRSWPTRHQGESNHQSIRRVSAKHFNRTGPSLSLRLRSSPRVAPA